MSSVDCELCPKGCRIPDGMSGDCRVRVNVAGKLLATTYGRPASVHVDPMEKKPLFHFLPGSPIFSLATAGCNLHCKNCQNWQLSQSTGYETDNYDAPPESIVAAARERGCRSIAYTYSEPIVFYEYVLDTATLAREAGLANVMVTAGYINLKPLRRLCRVLDATNTNLKFFDDALYRSNCDATLKPVLDALVTFREEGVWLEVTNLLIPTVSDDLAMIRRMCRWILRELGAETPLHFNRFFPEYQLRNLPWCPVETARRARQEALDVGLKHVYCGNLHGEVDPSESTFCAGCGKRVVERQGFSLLETRLEAGRCGWCGRPVAGVWSPGARPGGRSTP